MIPVFNPYSFTSHSIGKNGTKQYSFYGRKVMQLPRRTAEQANNACINIDGEEWRDVAEYEGLYQVSNFGRVKRLPTTLVEYTGTGTIVNERTREAYMLNPTVNVHGYYQVGLTKNGKTWSVDVHLLVARAFVPHDEYRNIVHHKDRISTNNHCSNLQWVTKEEHKELHRDKSRRDYLTGA